MAFRASVRSVSPIEFLATFIPFVILIFIALFTARAHADKLNMEVINSARATMILFTAAIALYALPDEWPQRRNYWLLLWTFTFAAYLIHLYFSLFLLFHGSISSIFTIQGTLLATTNLIITAWWIFDVTLAWFSELEWSWIRFERTGLHVLLLITFFLMTVLGRTDGKEPLVLFLGLLQVIAVAASLGYRWWLSKQPKKSRIKTN